MSAITSLPSRWARRARGRRSSPASDMAPIRRCGRRHGRGRLFRLGRGIGRQGLDQGAELRFIGLPALQRGAIDRPAHLIDAGGPDRAVGLVEGDAAGIPGQAAVVQDAPGLGLDILDHRLVLHLQHRARRQHPAPMLHQIEIHPVIAAELPQIVGIVDLVGEMLAEAGQAGVERVAAQMNDPRLGQDEMDEPDEHVVVGHLVGDPAAPRAPAPEGARHRLRRSGDTPRPQERAGIRENTGSRGPSCRRRARP